MKHFYTRVALSIPILLVLFALSAHAQVNEKIRISGTVYDMSRTLVLPSVSVLSKSGAGTMTDSAGRYSILVDATDSIWFSYLNKPTPKFPVSAIINQNAFDISLHVPVTDLKEVRVAPRNYKQDSAQNRLDYAKAFNYKKPGISLSAPSGSFGVGLNLDDFINMFSFARNRRMAHFRERLIQEEQDKAVDHRFTHALVKKITGLDGKTLDDFMKRYRPSYIFAMTASDYEFGEYIKLALEDFRGK
ncbi:MAG: hypothetical protein JST39_07430 [Bacteroidetes bacterium]|nr:hypothetical protein [Bacteroidota bacterium]